ncbi:MAG: 3-hydroxyacyl-CoA dehydrogenase/enoyl-CoA hydratase family protein [Bacteroidota bacterium]
MKKIKNVGIVGGGTMGSALAQKFAQENFDVTLYDIDENNLRRGLDNIKQSLNEGLEKKVFTSEQINTFLSRIKTTCQIEDLKDRDIVIEAVFEDFNVKSSLFKKLSEILSPNAIIATNTSSFSVTELSQNVKYPERFIGLHYFYHAAKNRLVEIIPGQNTAEEVIQSVYYFSLQSGKDPIFTKDYYGFAVNRFFVPWLNESVKIVEEKIATPGEVDWVSTKVFGIGMGPFALMNATGVPIAYHSQKTLEKIGPSYKVTELLKYQAEKKENWSINAVENVDSDKFKMIEERLLGCVFFVCAQLLNEKICSPTDLNKGARIGLKWKKGPIELMREYGLNKVNDLISKYKNLYKEGDVFIGQDNLKLKWITKKIIRDVGYILFNRPEDLNALNEEVFQQIEIIIDEFNHNPSIKNIIITSTGKSFVAGADIKFFIQNIESKNIDKIIQFTKYAQSVLNKIDASPKRVIAVLNGLTLGGGLELALCADEIYALPNVTLAFPETGIGIYPGLGGTQRPQKRIGKELTKFLVFTGKVLTAKDANEIHLIDGVIYFDDYINILNGEIKNITPSSTSKSIPEQWVRVIEMFKKINIQQLSPLDEISRKILQKAPLAIQFANKLIDEGKGPESEIQYLRDIFSSHDALIGLKNIGKKVQYTGK